MCRCVSVCQVLQRVPYRKPRATQHFLRGRARTRTRTIRLSNLSIQSDRGEVIDSLLTEINRYLSAITTIYRNYCSDCFREPLTDCGQNSILKICIQSKGFNQLFLQCIHPIATLVINQLNNPVLHV